MAKAKKEDKKKTEKKRQNVSKGAKRKLIPAFIMLTAGALAAILMVKSGYELHRLLFILFIVLLLFYILGCILKYTLDRIEKQNTPEEPDEGEVIEKEPEEPVSDTETSEEG